MLCPNCKKELVEINGRYVCSDCGKEVPASEVNVGNWGEDKEVEATAVAPGSESITDYNASSGEDENYIADSSGQPPVPEITVPATEMPTPETNITEIVPTETEATEASESSFADMAVPGAVAGITMASDIPVSPEASQTPEITIPEPPIADDFVSPEPKIADVMSTSLPVEPVAPVIPVEPEPMSEPLPAIPSATVNEAMVPDPLYALPHDQGVSPTMPDPQDFYQVKPNEAPAEVPAPVAIQGAAVAGPLPMDPNIYRDPLYDTPSPDGPQEDQQNPDKFVPPAKNRLNMILIISGVALALLFLGGGVAAYFVLTSKAKVAEIPVVSEPTITDCDGFASTSEKTACIDKNFAACSLATWTTTSKAADGTTINETKNDVLRADEGGCSMDITYTKNTDATLQDQSMTCSLDNTLTYANAIAKNSSSNCSGSLADMLYPVTTPDPASE